MEPPGYSVKDEGQAPETTTAELAGFWIRLGAYLMDVLLLTGVSWIICFLIGLIAGTPDLFQFPPLLRRVWFILFLLFSLSYFAWFWRQRGQTLGKMAVGIKVVRTNALNPDWSVVLLRLLGYAVSPALLFIPFLWVAFDARKQGLHDKLADTYVIMVPKKRARAPRAEHYAAVERAA
ncbi:MAG: RDD family protein [Chloroflexota bacterium]